MLSGCIKPENDPENKIIPVQNTELMIQGAELEDPYSIDNIIRAYSNLQLNGADIPVIEIKPNHLYLKFMPSNEEELNLLKKDTTIQFFDFPLNIEITGDGTAWQEPSIKGSGNFNQYCVVPAGKELPAIHHEVIYEVFIPPDESNEKGLSDEMISFYDELEYESARITGNLDEKDALKEKDIKGFLPSRWIPRGTIMAWDDLLGQFIPIANVNVHARWFTHVETAVTDENGYFQTGKFRYAVNYAIKWESSYYTIRNGLFLQAWYNGPKMKSDWNLEIKGGHSLMYATIHRAATKFFYGDNLGIPRPILKDGSRTKICYRDSDGEAQFRGDWSASGILPDIVVWGKSNGRYKPTTKIFGNTSHELGHQTHSQYIGNSRYWKTSKIIRESWADGVEWALSNDEYHKLGQKYGNTPAMVYNHYFNTHNYWPFVEDKDYSPIFIDLMDNVNQRTSFGPAYPNDLVSGYTLSYLNNNILLNSSCLNDLHNEVKRNIINDVTDFEIEELFKLY